MRYKNENEDAHSYSYSKAGDVDKGVQLILK